MSRGLIQARQTSFRLHSEKSQHSSVTSKTSNLTNKMTLVTFCVEFEALTGDYNEMIFWVITQYSLVKSTDILEKCIVSNFRVIE